jgi:hypothetical protein
MISRSAPACSQNNPRADSHPRLLDLRDVGDVCMVCLCLPASAVRDPGQIWATYSRGKGYARTAVLVPPLPLAGEGVRGWGPACPDTVEPRTSNSELRLGEHSRQHTLGGVVVADQAASA